MYQLSYKDHSGNLQVSVKKYIKVQFSGTKLMYRLSYKHRLEIKVQFRGTKLIYRLGYKYRLGNLQVSVRSFTSIS